MIIYMNCEVYYVKEMITNHPFVRLFCDLSSPARSSKAVHLIYQLTPEWIFEILHVLEHCTFSEVI